MKKFLLLIPMILAVFLLISVQAQALQLTLDDMAGNSLTIVDGDGNDINPIVGVVSWSGALGVWAVNVSTGLSKPILGSTNTAQMDLNSINFSEAAGTIVLTIEDTGFGPLPGQDIGGVLLTNRIGGTTQGEISTAGTLTAGANSYMVENNNGLPMGPGAFSDTASINIAPFAVAFDLKEVVTIVHARSGNTSFDKELTAAVPEPATMLLSGLGLLGLGVYLRRRRRSKKA